MPSGFRFESINSQVQDLELSKRPYSCLALYIKCIFFYFLLRETRDKLFSLFLSFLKNGKKNKRKDKEKKKAVLETSSLVTVLFLSLSDLRFCLNCLFDLTFDIRRFYIRWIFEPQCQSVMSTVFYRVLDILHLCFARVNYAYSITIWEIIR